MCWNRHRRFTRKYLILSRLQAAYTVIRVAIIPVKIKDKHKVSPFKDNDPVSFIFPGYVLVLRSHELQRIKIRIHCFFLNRCPDHKKILENHKKKHRKWKCTLLLAKQKNIALSQQGHCPYKNGNPLKRAKLV